MAMLYFDLGEKKLVIDAGEFFFAFFLSAGDGIAVVDEEWSLHKSDSIAASMSPLLFPKTSLDT